MESEFIDLSEDKGVLKKIIEIDENQPQIETVLFKGTLDDGTVFDESIDPNDPFSFVLGVDEIIEGWNIGISSMKVKEKSILIINPNYGYKQKQIGKIKPNSTLNFEIEILQMKQISEKWDFSREERIKQAQIFKDEGNNFFKNKEYQQAINKYKESEEWLKMGVDDEELDQLQVNILNNMAAVYIQLENWSQTIQSTDKVIEIQKNNIKALYRRGKAKFHLGLYEESKNDLNKIIIMDPNDSQIKQLYKVVMKKYKEDQKSRDKIYQLIFDNQIYEEENKSQYSSTNNPKVFLDIQIGKQKEERIIIELFSNIVPITSQNFIQLCQQKKYAKTPFHRLIRGFIVQGGDYQNKNGTGGKSIYGQPFKDENFTINHNQRGLISMTNQGPNTNGSQFFILFKEAKWIDGKHVAFGLIIKNLNFLQKIQNVETDSEAPIENIIITDCGQI